MTIMINAQWNVERFACYTRKRLEALYPKPVPAIEALTRTDGLWASVSPRYRQWLCSRIMAEHPALQTWLVRLVVRANGYAANILSPRHAARDAADRAWTFAYWHTDRSQYAGYAALAASHAAYYAATGHETGTIASDAEIKLQVADAVELLTQGEQT